MPVPTSTVPSHSSMPGLKPFSKSRNVIGPGAMKKTKIQIGQWLKRYEILLRSRMRRSEASSMRRAWPRDCSYEGGSIDRGPRTSPVLLQRRGKCARFRRTIDIGFSGLAQYQA
jgi:hypothetical protein